MNARGIDVSEHNAWVTRPLLSDWKGRYGLCYGYRRTYIGSRRDPYGVSHFLNMQAEGYLTGPYGVPFEPGPLEPKSMQAQCALFIASRQEADTLPNWVDVERRGLTERMVLDWVDYYDNHTNVELWVYTGKFIFETIIKVNYERFKKYGLVIADYGPGLATAVPWPRPPGRPFIPKPWIFAAPPYYDMWQYAGDNGRLWGAPVDTGIDLSEYKGTEAELRERFGQESVPATDDLQAEIEFHANAILEKV